METSATNKSANLLLPPKLCRCSSVGRASVSKTECPRFESVLLCQFADVAQLVERQISNLNVASSNLVVRSKTLNRIMPL